MTLFRNIFVVIMTVLAFVPMNAKIATWLIHPKYEKLTRFNDGLFLFLQNGKWGIIKGGDVVVLPAEFEYVTPLVNGYALCVSKEGTQYRLRGILDENGAIAALNEQYYISISSQHDYAYFSEDKLVVYNQRGKYGYIDPVGNVVIKCQFDDALPFKDGWGPVLQGNYMRYVNEDYDQDKHNMLAVDFHFGDMTDASCFSNGQAAIAYNNDYAIIDKNGVKIRKIKRNEFDRLCQKNNARPNTSDNESTESSRYDIISGNGKYGLKEGETIVVKPQFDSFSTQYTDGTLLTVHNGKYGLLKIADEEIGMTATAQGNSSNELEIDRKGQPNLIVVEYKIPSCIQGSKLLVDSGDGTYRDMTPQATGNGLNQSVSVTPIIGENAETCSIKTALEYDGIIQVDMEKAFTVSYPIKLRLTAPGPSTIWANESDMATFSSTIFNDSNKQVTVTATWSTGKSQTVTIPPHQSETVFGSISVETEFNKTIGLTLSSGEKTASDILFKPYY